MGPGPITSSSFRTQDSFKTSRPDPSSATPKARFLNPTYAPTGPAFIPGLALGLRQHSVLGDEGSTAVSTLEGDPLLWLGVGCTLLTLQELVTVLGHRERWWRTPEDRGFFFSPCPIPAPALPAYSSQMPPPIPAEVSDFYLQISALSLAFATAASFLQNFPVSPYPICCRTCGTERKGEGNKFPVLGR